MPGAVPVAYAHALFPASMPSVPLQERGSWFSHGLQFFTFSPWPVEIVPNLHLPVPALSLSLPLPGINLVFFPSLPHLVSHGLSLFKTQVESTLLQTPCGHKNLVLYFTWLPQHLAMCRVNSRQLTYE